MKVGYLQTKFWTDPYVQTLSTIEKLLFIYLRTNQYTSICGIYELSLKTMSFETGLSEAEIIPALETLAKENKVHVHKNFVNLVNAAKNLYKPNDNLMKGIDNERALLPKDVLDYFTGLEEAPYKPLISPSLPPPTKTLALALAPSLALAPKKSKGVVKPAPIPPTFEEVQAYAKTRKYTPITPQKFFDYYSTAGWVDRDDKPIKNWKLKFITWENAELEKHPELRRVNETGDQYFERTTGRKITYTTPKVEELVNPIPQDSAPPPSPTKKPYDPDDIFFA